MGSAEPPKLLPPLSQTQPMRGMVVNELLKILPDKINSRQQRNIIMLKNRSDSKVYVEMIFDEDVISTETDKFWLEPLEQKSVMVQHLKELTTEIAILASQGENASTRAVVKVYE